MNQYVVTIRQELARLGVLRSHANPDGFVVLPMADYDRPAVCLDEGWSCAHYDTRLLAAILPHVLAVPPVVRDNKGMEDFWEQISVAELCPRNGLDWFRSRLPTLSPEFLRHLTVLLRDAAADPTFPWPADLVALMAQAEQRASLCERSP